MKIRFSIRWLLLAVAYVALVTAACVGRTTAWSAALWLVTALSAAYALLTVVYHRGQTQAMALGFLLLMGAYLASMHWAPEMLPTPHIAESLGIIDYANDAELAELPEIASQVEMLRQVLANPEKNAIYQRLVKSQQRLEATEAGRHLVVGLHATGAMLAGVIGALLGAHVWSRAQRGNSSQESGA